MQTIPRHAAISNTGSSNNSNSKNNYKGAPHPNNTADKQATMEFLKKIGRVGGTATRDFRYAIGVDEGESGKSVGKGLGLKKACAAYTSCTVSGVIDDMRESFPTTSIGTQWSGFTDQVMGGMSMAHLVRETYRGRTANVLRGHVSLANNGGFVQMATNLNSDAFAASVDAASFDGVEIDVACHSSLADVKEETFNVHLKNINCIRPFSSYRATFAVPSNVDSWTTIRIPWEQFRGHGPGASEQPFDTSTLIRAGIVAIGREMDVELGIAGFRFYRQEGK